VSLGSAFPKVFALREAVVSVTVVIVVLFIVKERRSTDFPDLLGVN